MNHTAARPSLLAAAVIALVGLLLSATTASAADNGAVTASVGVAVPLGLQVKLVALPSSLKVGQTVGFIATVKNTTNAPIGPVTVELLFPDALFFPQPVNNPATIPVVNPGIFGQKSVIFALKAKAPGNAVVIAKASKDASSADSNAVVVTITAAASPGGGPPPPGPGTPPPGIIIWIPLSPSVVPNLIAPPVIYIVG